MITAANYANIVCSLEKASVLQQNASDEIIPLEETVNATNASDLKKKGVLNQANALKIKIEISRATPYQRLNDAFTALQNHVTKHYGSVNSFLADNNITVSPYFASLSASLGYTISSGNIGSSCVL